MKKIIIRTAVLTATFLIGLTAFAFVFLYFNPLPEITSAQKNSPEPEKPEKADSSETGFPGLSKKISEIKKGKSEYFPQQIFGNDMSSKGTVAGWYSKHLKAMDEVSLLDAANDAEIYRFLWLRSFRHPVFVRVVRDQNRTKLFTKELDGAGGYEPGKVLRSIEIDLKPEDFDKFLKHLKQSNYWNLPTESREDAGFDGAQWILEGVRDGRYHIVDRWSPQSGEYRQACIYLLKLSGIDTDRLNDDLY